MTTGYTPDGYAFTAAYDAENRLKSLEYTDALSVVHKTEYSYRADGFLDRIKKYEDETPVSDVRIVRNGFLPIQDRDGTNTVVRQYTWGLDMGGGIGGLLDLKQGGQSYSYLYDGKGNITSVIDGSENVVAEYAYGPFGEPWEKTATIDQPFRFSTKRYDEQTGLYYYGYRFYSPQLGTWLSRDPLGETGGINLYEFVYNNPLALIDPDGLLPRRTDKRYGKPNDFWKYAHKIKEKLKVKNLSKDQVEELYEEWKNLGEPPPDQKGKYRKERKNKRNNRWGGKGGAGAGLFLFSPKVHFSSDPLDHLDLLKHLPMNDPNAQSECED